MKAHTDCIPCFLKQTRKVAEMLQLDESKIESLLNNIEYLTATLPDHASPPFIANIVYKEIRHFSRIVDPYMALKKKHIQEAKKRYPYLKEKITQSPDPLLTAIRLAIAGNVIDMGIDKEFDLINDIEQILQQDFAIFDYALFRQKLGTANSILYLGDNAGESVFDKLLIEELPIAVEYVTRETPIINDVTIEDAIASGLDEVAKISSSGTTAPGVLLELCHSSFIEKFTDSEFIISKGQGNYEGLSDTNAPIFFLLKAKCPVIADHLGVKENDIIFKYNEHAN
jgi:uncharacterized protein with ATP-grasp and redox domains